MALTPVESGKYNAYKARLDKSETLNPTEQKEYDELNERESDPSKAVQEQTPGTPYKR